MSALHIKFPDQPVVPAATLREWLGCSSRTLSRMRTEGSGPPYVRIRGQIVYRVAAVEEWLRHCERTRTDEDGR